MIALEYNISVHKILLSPVLGTHQPNQTGLFDVIAFESFKGYVENVFFPLGRAATPKKEIFNKSTTCFMSWEQCFRGYNSRKDAHYQKIDLVINASKQFLLLSGQIFRGFKFLVS